MKFISQIAEQLHKQFRFKYICKEKVVFEENDDAKKADKYLTHSCDPTQC